MKRREIRLTQFLIPVFLRYFQHIAPIPKGTHLLVLHGRYSPLSWLISMLHPASAKGWNILDALDGTIPLPANNYDTIMSTAPFHRHPQGVSVLRESTRLLRSGGSMYLYTRHSPSFTADILEQELHHLGFSILSSSPQPTNRIKRWLRSHATLITARYTSHPAEYD